MNEDIREHERGKQFGQGDDAELVKGTEHEEERDNSKERRSRAS